MSSEKGGYPSDNQPPSYAQAYPQEYGSPPQNQQYGMGQSQYSQQSTTYIQTAPVAPVMAYQPPAEDHMCRAIFATFCCFWPIGIFAIMKASEARSAYARGDAVSGQSASSSARQLSNIAIGVGVASIVIAAIIVGVYVGVVLSYFGNSNKYNY